MGQTMSKDPHRYVMERADAFPAWFADDRAPTDEVYTLTQLDDDGYRESQTGQFGLDAQHRPRWHRVGQRPGLG